MTRRHIHFVTGRLAAQALEEVVAQLAPKVPFDYSIQVLNITVAALMTTPWVARRIAPPKQATEVLLPGYCQGELKVVEEATGLPVARGPKDLRQLPEFFGRQASEDYGSWDIQILAEINYAPRLSVQEVVQQARQLARQGADLIDLGTDPGQLWTDVDRYVRALRDQGLRVSIDSFDPREIEPAVRAGAELVLSVNKTNLAAAPDWGVEVVVVPDEPGSLAGLERSLEYLSARGVPVRLDPILEPIGFGFADSLRRYWEVRRRWPEVEMLMGIGNLTELTDADSAGVNVLLLGFCQELGIRSVLTTQVIPWAQSSVRECHLARRLVHYAVTRRTLPKRLEPQLVLLRDTSYVPPEPEHLEQLARQLRDPNYRIFARPEGIHLVSAGLHLVDDDPFVLFEKLLATGPKNLDPSHAFYLGYEMAKAQTARTLGKNYHQDESLDWGFLTRPEVSHQERKKRQRPMANGKPQAAGGEPPT